LRQRSAARPGMRRDLQRPGASPEGDPAGPRESTVAPMTRLPSPVAFPSSTSGSPKPRSRPRLFNEGAPS